MDDGFQRRSDLHIRAEDYRDAWPQALARSMHAASDLLDRITDISDSQTVHQDRLEVLGSKMPTAIRAAEDILIQRGDAFGQVIDASMERALDSIATLSAQVEHDIQTAGAQMRQEAAILVATQQRFTKGIEMLLSNFDYERKDHKALADLVVRQAEELAQVRLQVQQLQQNAKRGFFRRTLIGLGLANPET